MNQQEILIIFVLLIHLRIKNIKTELYKYNMLQDLCIILISRRKGLNYIRTLSQKNVVSNFDILVVYVVVMYC